MKNSVIHDNFKPYNFEIDSFISNFDIGGEDFGNQQRNSLKLFKLNDGLVNIKSFRIPNIVNQIAYKFFRKSKAQRSFEYANKLTSELNIGTPQPIAYYEFKTPFLFKKSYYISEHLSYDLTYRELTTDLNYPDHENILREFTKFTYKLHENGINFLDHSPGNTLIKKVNGKYFFYLVDLNRMEFKFMNFETRIRNFARLTIHKSMVEVMSDEYAKCLGKDYNKVFNLMWYETEAFQAKYHQRRRIKNKIKFWKSAR